MKLPRVRFTVRRMMISVAVVAILFGGGQGLRRWSAMPAAGPSKKKLEVMSLAAKAFGPMHWTASSDVDSYFYDARLRFCVLGRGMPRLIGGAKVMISPCAIIWLAPDGTIARTVTGDSGCMDIQARKGGAGPLLKNIRLQGNVRASSLDFDMGVTPEVQAMSQPPPM